MLRMRMLVLVAAWAVLGCADDPPVAARPRTPGQALKADRPWPEPIADPHEWALEAFADGPIEGPDVSEWARMVAAWGLLEKACDLDGDGTDELLLARGVPARMRHWLVFVRQDDAYRYLGGLDGSAFRPLPAGPGGHTRVLVYEPSGGHYGYVKTYIHDGERFVCVESEGLAVGDGSPDENNRRVAELFGRTDR